MNHALLLACGNALRGDDGIALFIARSLLAGLCDPRTEILSSQQWTPELAEPISKAGLVIFLDASVALAPGEILLQPVAPAADRPGSLTHSMSPAGLLALAQQLYEKIPASTFLLTVGGKSFENADEFSEPVRLAIPAVMTQVKALLSGVSMPTGDFRSLSASF